MPLTKNIAVALIAATTWIFSQYEFSAGTSGPALTYRTVPGEAQVQHDRHQHENAEPAGLLASQQHQERVTTMNATTVENSYMLPHGTRWAAKPRVTMVAMWANQPKIVTPTAIAPGPAVAAFGLDRHLHRRRAGRGGGPEARLPADSRRRRRAPSARRPARSAR